MKRLISFVLAFIMLIGPIASFAAPGDIIHTGRKSLYRKDLDENKLSDALLQGADVSKFYTEIEGKKFVNMVAEEDKQFKYMENIIKKNSISSKEGLDAYIDENAAAIDEIFAEFRLKLAKDFDSIDDDGKGSLEDYFGPTDPPKEDEDKEEEDDDKDKEDDPVKEPAMLLRAGTHYSNLSKASEIGGGKVKLSASPSLNELFDSHPATINWRYLVSKDNITVPEADSFLADTLPLSSDTGFKVASEEELRGEDNFNRNLLILASEGSDSDFKIKAYAVLKLNAEHIKYPNAGLLKEDTHYSKLEKGATYGTSKISKLLATGIDGHASWWTKLSNGMEPGPIEYKEVISFSSGFRSYSQDGPIKVDDNKWLTLVSVDANRKVLAYGNIKLDEDSITAAPAPILKPNFNYEGPERGSIANSSRFSKLYGQTNSDKWFVRIGDKSFGFIESGIEVKNGIDGFKEYKPGDNMEDLKPGQWILLIRTNGENKVTGYVNIQLNMSHIRDKDAQEMTSANYKIGQGDFPGNTKLYDLNPGGIDGISYGLKWMYKLIDEKLTGEGLPYLNQRFEDARELPASGNIDVGNEPYGYILLLATDNGGQTKAYIQIPVNKNFVKESAEDLAIDIGEGDAIDRIKFVKPKGGTDLEESYMYKVDSKPIASPALKQVLYGAKEYKTLGNVGILVEAGNYLMIYKVDGDNKILAYKSIPVKDEHMRKGQVNLEDKEILQGSIENGGEFISFTLEGQDQWNDVKFDPSIRNKLYDGLKASSENTQWLKIVNTLKSGGEGNIFVDGKTINIRLPGIKGYNISQDQIISLTVPAEAVKGAIRTIEASGYVTIRPTLSASISGSLVSAIVRQADIKSGGPSLEIKLEDSYWNMDVKDILSRSYVDGIEEDKQATTNWAKIKAEVLASPNSVIVTDEKTVKITLPPVPGVNYGSNKEVVTMVIDGKYVVGAKEGELIVASPTFTIYPDVLKIDTKLAEIHGKENIVVLMAPDNRSPLEGRDTWIVELTNSTLNDTIGDKDFNIIGLPNGLKTKITRLDDKKLSIQVTGTASSKLIDGSIRLVVNGSAVKELNSVKSQDLYLNYKQGAPMDLDNIKYEIKKDGIYLSMDDGFDYGKIAYSLNSKDGIGGDWKDDLAGSTSRISELVGPVSIYVREKAQPKVFRKIVDLNHGKAPLVSVEAGGYEYINKDGKNLLNISVKSEEEKLEYSKDGGLEWFSFDADKRIVTGLEADSILVLRIPGELGIGGKLPSLASSNLNNLFLGDVELLVSQGKIKGASRDMKYKLSDDGSLNNITSNDPIVDFKQGNRVWVADAKDENNKKFLGEVLQSTFSPDEETKFKKILNDESDDGGIYYHIADKKIVNKTRVRLQYNISKGQVPSGNWFRLEASEENVNFLPGNVFVRKIEGGNYLPSYPVKIFEIKDPINPPDMKVNPDSKAILYEDSKGDYKTLDVGFEYRIGNGDYQNGDLFEKDPMILGNMTVYVKKKATARLLPSKEISFKFTENISLANVRVNVAQGLIEGTSDLMEYRTSSDSPWTKASRGQTSVNMYEDMNIWIRELAKPSSERRILENLQKMGQPNTNESSSDKFVYNIGEKLIQNNDKRVIEYTINGGPWSTIGLGEIVNIDFKPSSLAIRTKSNRDNLASDPIILIDHLDYPDLEPSVVYDDNDNKIKSIEGLKISEEWKIFEFRLKGNSQWKPGEVLGSYDLSGDKIIEIRRKATDKKLPSEIGEIVFTKNINLDAVRLRRSKPLELIYSEAEMEYKIYSLEGPIPDKWKKANSGTTDLDPSITKDNIKLIVIRDSRDPDKLRILKGNDNEIGSKDDLPISLDEVDYSIEHKNNDETKDLQIVFTGISKRMEYKLAKEKEWKAGTDSPVISPLDITELNIRDKDYHAIERSIIVSEKAETPTVTVDKVVYDKQEIKITLGGFLAKDVEYSIDNGGKWENVPTDKVFTINSNGSLLIRAKAISSKKDEEGKGKLPSEASGNLNITFLNGVTLNIDRSNKASFLGTNKFMEYSLNSKDGKDGTWTGFKDNNPSMDLKIGMTVWIREAANVNNSRKIGPIGQEPAINLSSLKVYYDISKGKIAHFSGEDLEYRMLGGDWIPINELRDNNERAAFNVDFKTGPLDLRRAAKASNFASKAVTLTVIKAAGSVPNVFYDDIEDRIISIEEYNEPNVNLNNYEYRVTIDNNTSNWTSAAKILEETFSRKQTVEIRIRSNKENLPSQISKIDFTDNIIKRVKLSAYVKPLELNGTRANMEYMINDSKVWLSCSDVNTKLLRMDGKTPLNDIKLVKNIKIRLKGEEESVFTVWKK